MSDQIALSETPATMPLARELVVYWMQHPERLGSIETIVEWWLLESRIQHAATEVRSILAGLVEKGFVIERQQMDGRYRYELNREKENEINVWLSSSERGKPAPSDCSCIRELSN
jgi:hypothetical protein